jgi:hypothetical protein
MRALRPALPFLLAPILVLVVVAAFGDGTGAAIVGLIVAGLLGGLGAWFVFGSPRESRKLPPSTDEYGDEQVIWSALSLRVTMKNGDGASYTKKGGSEAQISGMTVR